METVLVKFIINFGVCVMCAIGIGKSVEIVKTVLSGLGFGEVAENLEVLHNLTQNLNFESKESKELFIEKLQKSISDIINSENIDSSVQEIVNYTFAKFFNEEDLIEYYGNKDKLVEKLLRNWGDHSTIGKDYEAFEKLVRTIITSLYDNIYEFIKTGKLVSEALKYLLETQNDIKELNITTKGTNADVKELLNAVGRIEEAVLPTSNRMNIQELKIVDDNGEYFLNYLSSMFMEYAFNDDEQASLESIFIEPILESDGTTLLKTLKEWSLSTSCKYTQKPIFLLYGKAGVGKSSVTSHIISKTILGKNCHAAMLRKYADKLSYKNAWESVKNIYECSDDNFYRGMVLILDGLDEVCVLQQCFDGKAFIEDLSDNIPDDVKILITSRNYKGYFSEVKATSDVKIDTIKWTDMQIENWCESYVNVHNCKRNWCKEFIRKYNELNDDDKRKEIFCIPIILYICCVCEIDIAEHNSVAGIYDAAFKKIGGREHARKKRNSELRNSDERLIDVNWQYTKELAFQMFLNDKLESALDNSLIKAAKAMTAKLCNTTESSIRLETDRYYAFFHFVSKNSEGIEFAHKTVGEYFTAVKLYEDYFSNTLMDMSNESIEGMWKNIFQAFRYKEIPEDIMQYFVELMMARKTNNDDSEDVNNYIVWRNNFINSYYKGIQEQFLWKKIIQDADYILDMRYSLLEHITFAFRNLTWLLTMIGFNNSSEESDNYYYRLNFESFFIRNIKIDVNLKFWNNLKGIKLNGVDLTGANFMGVDLSYADLTGANLTNANLEKTNLNNANLTGADLMCVNLTEAKLTNANLNSANLTNANLISVNLNNTNLINANLNSANLNGAYSKDSKFIAANFEKSKLKNIDFVNAQLMCAYLNNVNIKNSSLAYANLTDANLTDADFHNSYFENTKLVSIHLFENDLPKFDTLIKSKKIMLVNPIIEDVDMTKYFYDSETNRIRPIK